MQVVVGSGDELFSRTLRAKRLNWIAIDDLREPMRVQAKIRHRHEAADAVAREERRRRGAGHLRRTAARHHSRSGGGVL